MDGNGFKVTSTENPLLKDKNENYLKEPHRLSSDQILKIENYGESSSLEGISLDSSTYHIQEFPQEHPSRFLSDSHTLESVKVKEHNDQGNLGSLERKIMKDIEDKPISVTGELAEISYCPHDCNNKGVCQKSFVKTKTHENPDTYSYEPHFS